MCAQLANQATSSPPAVGPSVGVMLDMYERMLEIRLFEEKVSDVFFRGQMPGFPHLYIGEEASAVGVCSQLNDDDYVTSNHRGHGHLIAKGGDVRLMMAEIMGKRTGYCKGKGGTMHIADPNLGILGANGIVGAGIPIAAGAGLGCKLKGTKQVAVCFFGDGASNQGSFHEAVNLAAVWKLPVVFVCENNLYAISMSQTRHQVIRDIAVRGAAYGIPGVVVDGNDVLAVYEAAGEAVRRARAGEGPTILEHKTYRWRGHTEAEYSRDVAYRTKEELQSWMERCPIKMLGQRLVAAQIVSEEKLEAMRAAVQQRIDEAVRFALESPLPAPEEALEDIYAE